MYTYKILEKLSSSAQIASMSVAQRHELAGEVRNKISEVVNINGGHLGPNLGVVEIIIACHVVFQLDYDRLVFDVGHQSYPHKIVTGRFLEFSTLRQRHGISGYPYGAESAFDVFRSGHASTAISTSLGLACGYRLGQQTSGEHAKGERKKPHVVALVGDGALTGGMAFEALNHCGELNEPFIVILNDNSMSISPTVGGLAKASNLFRNSTFYNKMRDSLLVTLKKSPKWGEALEHFTASMLGKAHNFIVPSQIFTTLGIEYFGPVDGNNIEEMVAILKLAKNRKKTVVIHALTKKGMGYKPTGEKSVAIIGPHALMPKKIVSTYKEEAESLLLPNETSDACPKSGNNLPLAVSRSGQSYSKCFVDELIALAEKEENIVAITAAMPDGTGLSKFSEKYPTRYFDVGICEAHATGFSAGLSATGRKPVFVVYSTFLQRAFDQVFHEIVLQQNLAVIFAIDRAGLVGDDGPSHHGIFDIAYLRFFPDFVVMAPKNGEELKQMLCLAYKLKHPVAIRYPRESVPTDNFFSEATSAQVFDNSLPLQLGKAEFLRRGNSKVCLLAYGEMVGNCEIACRLLKKQGIDATLVNARFVKPLDGDMLAKVRLENDFIFTVEEGVKQGGFGSAVLEWLSENEHSNAGVTVMGVPDMLIEHASRQQQLQICGLSSAEIYKLVLKKVKATIAITS